MENSGIKNYVPCFRIHDQWECDKNKSDENQNVELKIKANPMNWKKKIKIRDWIGLKYKTDNFKLVNCVF